MPWNGLDPRQASSCAGFGQLEYRQRYELGTASQSRHASTVKWIVQDDGMEGQMRNE